MTNVTAAAVAWARSGRKVFPCAVPVPGHPDPKIRKGKFPLLRNGLHAASSDPAEVEAEFARHGAAMIGMRTGVETGVVVIDLDPPAGEESLIDLQLANDDLPQTYTVTTPRGGRHLYFQAWPGSQSTAGKIAPGVDVRGEGGYVIVPPSQGYVVTDSTPPAEAPDWLKELASKKEAPQVVAQMPVDPTTFSDEDLDKGDRYVRSVLDGERAKLAECAKQATPDPRDYRGPGWDDTTFRVACTLVELANSPWNRLTLQDAYLILLEASPRDPGWGTQQIDEKWASAVRKVGGQGRPTPVFHSGQGIFEDRHGTPPGDGSQPTDRPRVDPDTFFEKGKGLRTTLLAQAVLDMGPLAVDDTANRGIWKYDAGVWCYAPNEIQDRAVLLMGDRFRANQVTTIAPAITKALLDAGHVINCDPVTDYINTRSGMVEWGTGKLHPHDPAFRSTVQLPVEWKPEATCPNFDRFLAQVMPPDGIDFIWEVLGYLVLSGNPLQKAILFHGEGGNGKGTLMRVIESLLGARNTSSVTLQDISEGRFETASLFGKIANLAGDLDPTYMRSTAKFKAITGEDMIDAQRKYEQGFKFRCWAVPVFSANKFWKSSDTTEGYRRRWLLVPFPNRIEKAVAGLSDRLAAELPGILVKATQALSRLMARGEFQPPQSAKEAKDAFEMAADQVREWIEDDGALTVTEPARTAVWSPSSLVYSTYKSWAEASGVAAVSAREFRARLEQMGYTFKKVSVWRVYGISVDMSKRWGGQPLMQVVS